MIASVCPRAGGRWPRRDSHDPVADSASQTVPYVRVRRRAVWPRQCALAAQLGDAAVLGRGGGGGGGRSGDSGPGRGGRRLGQSPLLPPCLSGPGPPVSLTVRVRIVPGLSRRPPAGGAGRPMGVLL